MKVGVLGSSGEVALVERAEPVPGRGEIIVRLAACGICGTDLEKLRGNYRAAGILGHEPVGVIEQTGSGVSELQVGLRVFVHHHVPCYECPVCRRGDTTFCPSYSSTNLDPGGFAEQFRVPEVNVRRGAVLPLDPGVSWTAGALLEPAGCARTALRLVQFPPGGTVAILGLGPVGLLYARVARALGATWVGGADLSRARREAARAGGADSVLDARDAEGIEKAVHEATDGIGADLAVVATGSPSAVSLACRLPRRGGTVNLFGLPELGSRLEFDLQRLYLQGLRVVPTYATTEPDVAEVHRWIVERRLAVDDLVSHQIPLDRIQEAFRIAARPDDSLKVLVTGPAI